MASAEWFEGKIREFLPDLALSADQYSHLYRHFGLLNRWNERMDLTSVDTPEEIIGRHYCESLFFGRLLPESKNVALVDFGSGAGFPGFPIAVLRPEWRITLLEANQRRAVFLKEAARGLSNVSVVAQRGEQFDQKHDWVVARAVKGADVLRCVPRIASKVGILASETTLRELNEATVCKWAEPIRIPWSESRYCLFGECST